MECDLINRSRGSLGRRGQSRDWREGCLFEIYSCDFIEFFTSMECDLVYRSRGSLGRRGQSGDWREGGYLKFIFTISLKVSPLWNSLRNFSKLAEPGEKRRVPFFLTREAVANSTHSGSVSKRSIFLSV